MSSQEQAFGRRRLLKGGIATLVAGRTDVLAASVPRQPKLGVVVNVSKEESPDQVIAKVHAFGLPTCQVGVGMASPDLAKPLREALQRYQVEATAVMTLGPGRMVWDFYEGPKTIGLVPRDTRQERIDTLKRASDLAKVCGIPAVHTHCGFLPEDPNEPLYAESIAAIKEVASHCKANGQTFLMETGQETPVTLLRAIRDVNLDNIGANLDMANLVLYGKGDPVAALDVIGQYVRGTHAKDGLYPADPHQLGKETAIGKGRVNFASVIERLHGLSYSGPITIEREISGSKQEADIRDAKIYLQHILDRYYSRWLAVSGIKNT